MVRTSASVTIIHVQMSGGRVKQIHVKVQRTQMELWLASGGNNACTGDLSKADVPEVTSMSQNGLAILCAA